MILIISTLDDISTNDVIDWLLFYEEDFLRVSDKDLVEYLNVSISNNTHNISFIAKGEKYNLTDFETVWYRRGYVKSIGYSFDGEDKELRNEINQQLYTEVSHLNTHFLNSIASRSINKPDDVLLNKLDTLQLASSIGINIPDTIITSHKSELILFMEKHSEIISKNFSPGVFVKQNGNYISCYTQKMTAEIFNTMPDYFFPTMFQEMVNKVFELRVFFLEDEFYSSAIFSQNDDKTKVDFRNYNSSKPNRTPPYKLPNASTMRLKKLMKELKMNSGSIDLIITDKSKEIFLEINPIGQFAQVSNPCNYDLEQKMAKVLARKK